MDSSPLSFIAILKSKYPFQKDPNLLSALGKLKPRMTKEKINLGFISIGMKERLNPSFELLEGKIPNDSRALCEEMGVEYYEQFQSFKPQTIVALDWDGFFGLGFTSQDYIEFRSLVAKYVVYDEKKYLNALSDWLMCLFYMDSQFLKYYTTNSLGAFCLPVLEKFFSHEESVALCLFIKDCVFQSQK
jgi:hypothetical protein